MKTYITILVIALGIISCKAQTIVNVNTYNQGDNSNKYFKDISGFYDPFLGTWEGNYNDVTFRVVLWKVEMRELSNETNSYKDVIKGKFFIVENAGLPDETIKCQSEQYYPQSDSTWWSVIHAVSCSGVRMTGAIWDNCTAQGIPPQTGDLIMTITNSGFTPLIAHWIIKKGSRIKGHDFTIPKDIMLTKVN